ncbi:unnamed protein product [Porites evermanni]|uniref:Secreted protein n=1 Tax=Porites evermanni TaxID=104178 RepID=A0ABN8QKT7_9CNID|nr:unnamed protein product [Porites evermanni]
MKHGMMLKSLFLVTIFFLRTESLTFSQGPMLAVKLLFMLNKYVSNLSNTDALPSFCLVCIIHQIPVLLFLKALCSLVECISADAKETHFVEGFNIDLLLQNNSNSRCLKHLMENFSLHQMIDKPTHVAE